jgi:hypothetical protein
VIADIAVIAREQETQNLTTESLPRIRQPALDLASL